MKRNKIAILGIASLLSIGVLTGSLALYVDKDDDRVATIGGSVSTDGNFTLTETTSAAGIAELSPDHKSNTYSHEFNMITPENSTVTQDVSEADLEIKVTLPDGISYENVIITPSLTGYKGAWILNDYKFEGENVNVTGQVKTFTLKNLYFHNDLTTEHQGVNVEVKLADELVNGGYDAFESVANHIQGITIDYKLTKPAAPSSKLTKVPEFIGSYNNWIDTDSNNFVPDIDYDIFRWKHTRTMKQNELFRIRFNSSWNGALEAGAVKNGGNDSANVTEAAGNDTKVLVEHKYNIFVQNSETEAIVYKA